MGLQALEHIVNQDNKNLVNHITWGHLFPKEKRYFEGKIRVALSVYGDIIILDEDIDIPSSPWWYDAINDFTGKAIDNINHGEVHEIFIAVKIVDHEFFYEGWECEGDDDVDITKPYKIEKEFVITELKRTQLINGFIK